MIIINTNTSIINNSDISKHIIYYFNNKSNGSNDRPPVRDDIELAIAIHHSPMGNLHGRINSIGYIDDYYNILHILYINK